MICILKKIVIGTIFILGFNVTISSISVCSESIIDKKGRVVEDILAPTKEQTINPDTISDARRNVSQSNNLNSKFDGPKKNIYSNNTIFEEQSDSFMEYIKHLYDEKKFSLLNEYGELTQIRHTKSITDIGTDKYELINDAIHDRLKMKIIAGVDGIFYAKDDFYMVNGKIYYFDKDGYMVLGPAVDSMNNYYFFSYETGEMIDGN